MTPFDYLLIGGGSSAGIIAVLAAVFRCGTKAAKKEIQSPIYARQPIAIVARRR